MFQIVLPEKKLSIPRAGVMEKLTAAGIGSQVHYPAIHLFSLYRKLGWKEGDFPHAEYAGRNILTLPLFPTMSRADVARVVDALVAILSAHRKA
jgi:dTDP-4-amino-4,6-dideoxygalactose transaminase